MNIPPPPPERAKTNIFDDDFYKEIAHNMDPNQEVSPEALSFFNEIAEDFFQSILKETYGYMSGKCRDELLSGESIKIQPEDIYFILKTKFNMTNFPGGGIQGSTAITTPTAEYKEKLQVVRQFSSTHRDD